MDEIERIEEYFNDVINDVLEMVEEVLADEIELALKKEYYKLVDKKELENADDPDEYLWAKIEEAKKRILKKVISALKSN